MARYLRKIFSNNLPSHLDRVRKLIIVNSIKCDLATTMIALNEFLRDGLPRVFHITVTGRCNARCEGCLNSLIYGEREVFAKSWEEDQQTSLQALDWLIRQTNGAPTFVAFYGGEPLLVFDRVRYIAKEVKTNHKDKDLRFILYTNGMLLDKAISQDPDFFRELDFLFVSIDGTKEQHNRYRKGTSLEKIEKNLQILKKTSQTKVLMWSTLREGMRLKDCVDEFLKLYQAKLCDFFFWHLIELDKPIKDLQTFRKHYQEDLRHLLEVFLLYLRKGEVLSILPLAELIYFSLKGIRRGQTGCGVEKLRNFDILAGKVLPCVDMGEDIILADFSKGKLRKNNNEELKERLRHLVSYRDWLGCKACPAEFFCGGRCPVLIKTSPERAKQYCLLTQDLVSITKELLPLVKEALFINNIPEESLYYPYGWLNLLTDVVP